MDGKIVEALAEKFANSIEETSFIRGIPALRVRKESLIEISRYLRETPELNFDYLCFLTAIDYPERLDLVYYLYSMENNHYVILKVNLPKEEPSVETVTSVWPGADWHEREVFDLFGVNFVGHPDLRRILLPEDWEGFPLRKDYQQEDIIKAP